MDKSIAKLAGEYQALDRQAKEIDAKMKPLKRLILDYADRNRSDFDTAFQLKFPCGTYVSLRVSDVLLGDDDAKMQLANETGFIKKELDEKSVLAELQRNDKVKKLLTKYGIIVKQKETLAVYAG